MRIDVHAHYWPASYLDLLVSLGRTDLVTAGRQSDDFTTRLAEMDEAEVDLQILSAVGLNTEVADPEGATAAARHINDVYAEVIDKHPGRFNAFGSVPLHHVDRAVAETDRIFDELGFAGVALPCIVGGRPLDHHDHEPFWAHLAERDAVVYVHPVGSDSVCHPGLDAFGLQFALGSPTQVALAPLRIALSGLSTRHPGLRFVFALCGGTLPYLWHRYERNLRRGIEMSATAAVGGGFFDWIKKLPLDPDDPMGLLRNFWYDTSVQDIPEALRLTRNTVGADRLLLGSDAIFASLTESVRMIKESPDLTAAEKEAVLDHNAARMLALTTSQDA
ncbi:amidohydrolase family protein [Streptomyces sp. NPDC088746]|uniref:amidohydrolase family protein n=1 Tax=Streptomyces sp. NPDC088746 TaxID=3365885 RepID=UPI0037F623E8